MSEITEEDIERFSQAASFAAAVVNGLADLADENDFDLGTMALITCGLLAGRLVSSGLSREELIRQINLAIDAKQTVASMSNKTQ